MLLSLVMVFSMLFTLTACGDKGGAADAADLGPLKIGHLCDQTGVEAMTGLEAMAAMDFAVEYIGDICGRKIQVIHKDTQSNSAAAADAVRSLVEEDEVDIIFGPTLIGHKGAVANAAASYNIPVVFYNPTPAGMIADNDWVLAASGSTPQMPTVMADYVYNELGYTKVVTLTKDDTGGKSYMDPFTTNFAAMGGEVLDQAWAPAEDNTDYASYLMRLADDADEADCLVAWTSASSAMQLWKAWYQLGLNEKLPMVAVFHGAFTDSFICDALSGTDPELVDEILGTIAPMTWAYDMQYEETQDFVKAYQDSHDGEYPIGNNLPGATAQVLLMLKAAVEELDGVTSDHEALRDALKKVDINGPEGRTYFEEGSNIATKDVFVVKVVKLDNGQYHYGLVKAYENVPTEGLTVD